jgi:hypothetical protein
VHELGELLGELPSVGRDEPLRLGVLMIALNERLADAYKLLPPASQPRPGPRARNPGAHIKPRRHDEPKTAIMRML